MGEWRDTTIGAEVTLQRGFDITHASQREGPIPVISSGGVSSFHDEAAVAGPGVILGRKGVVGSVWYVESDYWPHDTTLWVRDFHGNEPRFVYYFFKWFASRIALLDVGSANPTLNRNHVHPIPVRWPPLGEQRRIARMLGALDDRIELNRRMSETLQMTARALFRSWFVAEAGTEAEGWRSCTIGDLAEVVGGSTPSTAEPRYWNGSHYWATPKDLAGLKTRVLLRTERMLTDAGIGQISSGLLPAGTVLMSSRAPIGYLAITEVPVAINQGFIAMKPRPGVSGLFLLLWAASSQDQILSRANGSTFLEISKSSFRPIEVLAPPSKTMAAFDRVARPIHDRVVANERQIDVLAKMRDALLPRLLRGEARLSAAAGT